MASISASLLFELPPKNLIYIFAKLDYKNILQCSLVCRELNELIASSTLLQYLIELGADGLNDNPSSTLTLQDRFSLLRSRRKRLDGKSARDAQEPARSLTIEGHCFAYELSGGVFGKLSGVPGREQVFQAVWLPQSGLEATVNEEDKTGKGSREEGESTDPEGVKRVKWVGFEFAVRDFAMDPTQDLLVFIETDSHLSPGGNLALRPVRLHLRTLTTNVSHPLAECPTLEHTTKICPIKSVCLQIVNDQVGFFSQMDAARLLVWNWRSGQLLVDCLLSDLDLVRNASDLTALPNRCFLVNDGAGSGAISLFAIPRSFSPANSITPTSSTTAINPLLHVAKFELPRIHDSKETIITHMSTHSGPVLKGFPEGSPFYGTSYDSQIIVLSLTYFYHSSGSSIFRLFPNGPLEFTMFIDSSVFKKYDEEFRLAGESSKDRPVVVPWEKWGPRHTRFEQAQYRWLYLRFTQGYRVVGTSGLNPTVKVLDFSPGVTRRTSALAKVPPGDDSLKTRSSQVDRSNVEYVMEPTTIALRHIFADSVKTTLPYRMRTIHFSKRHAAMFLDDDRLVGLKPEADQGSSVGAMKLLDIYYV